MGTTYRYNKFEEVYVDFLNFYSVFILPKNVRSQVFKKINRQQFNVVHREMGEEVSR